MAEFLYEVMTSSFNTSRINVSHVFFINLQVTELTSLLLEAMFCYIFIKVNFLLSDHHFWSFHSWLDTSFMVMKKFQPEESLLGLVEYQG